MITAAGTSVATGMAMLALCACSWDRTIPPTREYPCGPNGTVCTTQHTCCDVDEICGGEPNVTACPAGLCCFVGSNPNEHAARPARKQRPQ